jgi:hypothetical protein
MTRALSDELDRREAEADAAPDEGEKWAALRENLRKKLK